jgi:hypothetical protein
MEIQTYTGKRIVHAKDGRTNMDRGVCSVITSNGKPLRPIKQTHDRNPFEWSKRGSLSWNLAKSILADYFGDLPQELSEILVRRFYEDAILNFDYMEWQIDEGQLKEYFTRLYKEVYGEEDEAIG